MDTVPTTNKRRVCRAFTRATVSRLSTPCLWDDQNLRHAENHLTQFVPMFFLGHVDSQKYVDSRSISPMLIQSDHTLRPKFDVESEYVTMLPTVKSYGSTRDLRDNQQTANFV